ncbi:MAG: hypothetical protein KatS3mg087_1326 [Patescibacteria group bacterium]|nr:MAG: hypothetical protein KatS3mg087_1326 [Patescibacteria group bacterium]
MSQDLVPANLPRELTLPEYLRGEEVGLEGVKATDILLPRMVLIQSLSPQRQQDSSLEEGSIILSDGTRLAGPGECIEITPIVFRKEYLHFEPRSKGGSLIDRTFDENSIIAKKALAAAQRAMNPKAPRMSVDEDAYVESWNFYVWVFSINRPAIINCARTNVKKAREFLGLIAARGAPMYAGVYNVCSIKERSRDKRFIYWVYSFSNNATNPWVPEAVYRKFKSIAETTSLDNLRADYSTGDESADAASNNGDEF